MATPVKILFFTLIAFFAFSSVHFPEQGNYHRYPSSDINHETFSRKKIGVLFGTFDPPHLGHKNLALAMKNKFGLDVVYFIPRDKEDYKPGKQTIADRNKMVELLLEDTPEMKLVPSQLAAKVKGLRSEEAFVILRETFPADQISLLLGDDTIQSLIKNQVQIPDGFQLLVSRRDGNEAIEVPSSYDGKPVHVMKVAADSSSTTVRKILSEGGMPEMLPRPVYRYIKEQKLYGKVPYAKNVPVPVTCNDLVKVIYNQ